MNMNGCLVKLNEAMSGLQPAEQRVANYIGTYPEDAVSLSIGEISEKCDCSKATVIRFCRAIGFEGYKDFKTALTADIAVNNLKDVTYSDIHPSDSFETIVRNVCINNIKSIENTMQILDYQEIKRAVDAIIKARRVEFYGVGNSGIIAIDAQNKFMRINKSCCAYIDSHIQILSAANLSKEDVAVFISYSGETRDIIDTLKIARQSGATTIGITKYGRSTLENEVDIKLLMTSPETTMRSGAMGSRIAQLNMIDILYSTVVSLEYNEVKPSLDRTMIQMAKKRIGCKLI